MTKRRFIGQLGGNETIDDVFLASDKQLRPNRAGNLYLQVRLSDKSGSVTGMMWNANDRVYHRFENGDYVRVEGKSQVYNGSLQLIIRDIERVETEVDESEFFAVSKHSVDQLLNEVSDHLRSMKNEALVKLAECFLNDPEFVRQFQLAPAGVKLHHAYRGGLLEHVASLLRVADRVAPLYESLDPDLLKMGVFLHDLGKIEELAFERDLAYSDRGQLVGHIVQGVQMLDRRIAEWETDQGTSFPEELRWRLEHLIVSHHGTQEFGSPRVPMTPEAVALHFLDNLDAKLHAVEQVLESEVNPDSPWTPYEPSLGRKLFRGRRDTGETTQS